MEDFRTLETQELIDKMAYMTAQLTTKLTEKNSVELQQYEYDIALIQSEINSRQQTKANTNISETGMDFKSDITEP